MIKFDPKGYLMVLTVFLVSMGMVSFQLLLTRMYWAVLACHFAFLVISIAVLGLGMGGVVVYSSEKYSYR